MTIAIRAEIHQLRLRLLQLRQCSDVIDREIAIRQTRPDQVDKSSISVQSVPVLFQNRNQQVAQSTIGMERSGVDGRHGLEKARRDHEAAVQLCLERSGGEILQEGHVVFIGHGVHACVEVIESRGALSIRDPHILTERSEYSLESNNLEKERESDSLV